MRQLIDPDIHITAEDRACPSGKPVGTSRPNSGARSRLRKFKFQPHLSNGQKIAAMGGLALVLAIGGTIMNKTGAWKAMGDAISQSTYEMTANLGFRLDEITISGRHRTEQAAIATALGTSHGAPILSVDLLALKDRLESIPSIRVAAVERRLPNSLHLAVVEREPIAIWQQNGKHVLVDADGNALPGSLAGYENLMLVVGDGANQRATELMDILRTQPELMPRVKAAIRVGNRRWNLKLDHAVTGVEVRLPEIEPHRAWARLAQLEHNKQVLNKGLAMIDLRTPDRLVLKSAIDSKSKDDGV